MNADPQPWSKLFVLHHGCKKRGAHTHSYYPGPDARSSAAEDPCAEDRPAGPPWHRGGRHLLGPWGGGGQQRGGGRHHGQRDVRLRQELLRRGHWRAGEYWEWVAGGGAGVQRTRAFQVRLEHLVLRILSMFFLLLTLRNVPYGTCLCGFLVTLPLIWSSWMGTDLYRKHTYWANMLPSTETCWVLLQWIVRMLSACPRRSTYRTDWLISSITNEHKIFL